MGIEPTSEAWEASVVLWRVPGVYLGFANSLVLALFAFIGINNLHDFNRAFSSIPTAPTKLLQLQRLNVAFNSNRPFNNN